MIAQIFAMTMYLEKPYVYYEPEYMEVTFFKGKKQVKKPIFAVKKDFSISIPDNEDITSLVVSLSKLYCTKQCKVQDNECLVRCINDLTDLFLARSDKIEPDGIIKVIYCKKFDKNNKRF